MKKEEKIRIKELKKQGKYNEIYAEYGSKVYKKNTPRKVKNADIELLIKEKQFQYIKEKYGENTYIDVLIREYFREINESKVSGWNKFVAKAKGRWWDLKNACRFAVPITLLLIPPGGTGMLLKASEDNINENRINYAAEIETYNNKIEEYAKEVKSMDLSDIQTFMKVMDDMWKSIDGFGTPAKDIQGFYELDLASEDGYGVCRNMASDVAKKLNAINPEYNARTITVKMQDGGSYRMANIERHEHNEEIKNEDIEVEEEELGISDSLNSISKEFIIGNHLVTLVDIKEDNLILVLDPTNPGIGIYKNGEISMLNAGIEKDARHYEVKEVGNMFFHGGVSGVKDSIVDIADSFSKSPLKYEKIDEKYGIDAQNRALEEVRQMSAKENESETFRNEYKVDIEEIDREIDKIEQERSIQRNLTNMEKDERE
ncbi:MAG: hypothetical protein J6M60_05940 [Clostridia bacterium]|nr:hypothetical protein [Clostridia bacterium]